MTNHETPILEVVDAYKYYDLNTLTVFRRVREKVKAVRGISLSLLEGEALGLVGESGCGKSTLARLIVKLETPQKGTVLFRGRDIFAMSPSESKQTHRKIQLIFQNPFSALSPEMTIGAHVADALAIHHIAKGKAAIEERAKELLDTVGLGRGVYDTYPAHSSAGDLQMANIARALAPNPEILISDEGISVLDASEQAKILNLLMDLQDEFRLTYMIITHDLSVVRHICDRIVVMYLGKAVEIGDNASIFAASIHPYTKALIDSVPTVTKGLRGVGMRAIKGEVPSPIHLPPGCTFYPRCDLATDVCKEIEPELVEVMPGRRTACHHWQEVGQMAATN
ncbi:MAG: oligopeptide/dipeptide ABC transporter ATP-binding protein [Anaerolineales bacterium]|jgi:oligopeptide/dipeptide ABC transporter ATP-binding protein